MTKIVLVRSTLTDGSHVFDVRLPAMTLHPITEDDALALVKKIADAINEHTNDGVAVKRDY
jgi:hypothetical protein